MPKALKDKSGNYPQLRATVKLVFSRRRSEEERKVVKDRRRARREAEKLQQQRILIPTIMAFAHPKSGRQ